MKTSVQKEFSRAMLSAGFKHLHGFFSAGVVIMLTVCFGIPLYILALIKFLIRRPRWYRATTRTSGWLVERWIGCIVLLIRFTLKTKWDIQPVEGLDRHQWYFINSNHQFWTDIPVLLMVFRNHLPTLRVFAKREILWVPIVGVACWGMDFPFMKRYSRAYLKQHPEKRGEDLEITRRACQRYKDTPVAILNFIEGTRFRAQKHRGQQSPYRHLLRPRAGGFAYALYAMDGRISTLLDVTIVYPKEPGGLWRFLCGCISQIVVRVEKSQIPEEYLHGNYLKDQDFRTRFQRWVNEGWQKKDELIEQILQQTS
ncbi:MAG: acyltransferase [Desulfobacterales bacterium]|jgi:1-acyl-sn-glycerol-3-phosphate acyltransferase